MKGLSCKFILLFFALIFLVNFGSATNWTNIGSFSTLSAGGGQPGGLGYDSNNGSLWSVNVAGN